MTESSQIAVSAYAQFKYAKNSLIVLSNRHNFSPYIRNRGPYIRNRGRGLKTTLTVVRVVFRPETELTPFLRMRTKEIAKTANMYSHRRVIHL